MIRMTINKIKPVFCLCILIFIYRKYLLVSHFDIKCIVMFSIEQSVLFTILPLQEYNWMNYTFKNFWLQMRCVLYYIDIQIEYSDHFANKLLSVHYFSPSTCCTSWVKDEIQNVLIVMWILLKYPIWKLFLIHWSVIFILRLQVLRSFRH